MDSLHRVVSGGPITRRELKLAGIFVLVWFSIDVPQFVDWAWTKFNPPAACLPIMIPVPRTLTVN